MTFALRPYLGGIFTAICLFTAPSLWAQNGAADASKATEKGSKDNTTDKPKPTVKRTSTEKSVGKPMTVNPMKKAEVAKGCGCGFYAPTSAREDGPLLLWLDNKGNATITIDGKREQLKLSSERMVRRGKDTGKLSAGDRVLVTLRGANAPDAAPTLQASVSSSAERNCTISTSQCSAPTFKSLISLSRGDSRKSLAAWSVCSCPGSSKPYSPPPPAAPKADTTTAGSSPPQKAKQSETRPAQP